MQTSMCNKEILKTKMNVLLWENTQQEGGAMRFIFVRAYPDVAVIFFIISNYIFSIP